jgi:transcriptional regulator with XRE-family HTH domain
MHGSIAPAILLVNRHGYTVRPDDAGMIESLGGRVRGLRKALGLTQAQLAKQVGVTQSAISDIESGDTKVVLGPTMAALCVALHTNAEWLQHGRGSPAPAVTTDIEEGELLAIFRSLPDHFRSSVMTTVRAMQAATAAGPSALNPFPHKTRRSPTEQ